jgi:hypothetical protein
VTIGSRTYRFVNDLTGCAAGDVRVPVSSEFSDNANTTQANRGAFLAAAIMAESEAWVQQPNNVPVRWPTTNIFCPGTTPHPDVNGYFTFSSYEPIVAVQAKVGGAAGELALSQTGGFSLQYFDRTTTLATMKRHWRVRIEGASGGWAGIGSAGRIAEVGADANTVRVLYNSSTAGSWTGQAWAMRRITWDVSGVQYYAHQNTGDYPGPTELFLNGLYGLQIDGCQPSNTELECGRAFFSPDNQKGYYDTAYMTASSFTVSGGIGTITLASNWAGTRPTPAAVDARFYLRGFQKYHLQYNISTYADNGSGTTRVTTTAAHNCTAGVDQVHISGATGANAPAGTYGITVISTTQVDLTGKAYAAGWSGGILSCNPHGRQAQDEAQWYKVTSATQFKAFKTLTAVGNTFTFASLLADGTYTGSCVPAGSCLKTGVTGPVVISSPKTAPYLYIVPRSTTAGNDWFYPIDTLWFHSKNVVPEKTNRQIYWIKWPFRTRQGTSYNANLGTFALTSSSGSRAAGRAHFYHYLSNGSEQDEWAKYYFTGAASHQQGSNGAFPNNPTTFPGHPYNAQWMGGNDPNWRYYDGSTITYLDATGGPGPGMPENFYGYTTTYFGKIQAMRVDREPDGFVRNMTLHWRTHLWNGSSYDANTGVNVGFDGLQYDFDTEYYLRYSTTGSCKTLGWSNCTTSPGFVKIADPGGGYKAVVWASPTITPRPDTIWVGIRPKVKILSASPDGQPMWFYVRDDIGIEAGDTITVSGAGGNRDGVNRVVAEATPRRIWYIDEPTSGGWSTGTGAVLNITAASATCTANLRQAHGIVPGQFITVSGTTSAALGAGDHLWLNIKKYTVASTPTATSFTFACPGVADGVFSTNLSGYRFAIWAYPGLRINTTATGAPAVSGGVLEATSETTAFTEIMLEPYDQAPAPPPNAPTNLACSGVSTSQTNCTWTDASTDETSFQFERGIGSSYTFQATLAAGTVAYNSTGLAENTTYNHRVRACNAGGCSDWAGPVAAATDPVNPVPNAPSALTVNRISDTMAAISWTDNSDNEGGFNIEVVGQSNWTANGNETSLRILGLSPATEYTFRIQAWNGSGTSAWATATATTDQSGTARIVRSFVGGAEIAYAAGAFSSCTGYAIHPLGTVESVTNDETGYSRRSLFLSGLQPGLDYSLVVDCGSTSASLRMTTPAADSSTLQIAIGGVAPAGVDALSVDYGATGSLGSTASTSCTPGVSCVVGISATNGSILFTRRRWTYQGATVQTSAVERTVVQ